MEGTSRLYNELLNLLGQSKSWADLRHLQTLVWMVTGLIYARQRQLDQVGTTYAVTG